MDILCLGLQSQKISITHMHICNAITGPDMTHHSIAYYFKSALKPFSMVFCAFSLYKQNTKEPWGSVICDSDEGKT